MFVLYLNTKLKFLEDWNANVLTTKQMVKKYKRQRQTLYTWAKELHELGYPVKPRRIDAYKARRTR